MKPAWFVINNNVQDSRDPVAGLRAVLHLVLGVPLLLRDHILYTKHGRQVFRGIQGVQGCIQKGLEGVSVKQGCIQGRSCSSTGTIYPFAITGSPTLYPTWQASSGANISTYSGVELGSIPKHKRPKFLIDTAVMF